MLQIQHRDAAMIVDYHGEDLVFLISQPRCGSTMLQRILGSHSQIYAPQETWLMLAPSFALRADGLRAPYNGLLAFHALEDFLNHFGGGESTYLSAVRAWARVMYGAALALSSKQVFVDKTPRYYYIIPELRRFFPAAKFVFLLRNPLSVLSSILRTWVREDWPKLSHHRDDLLTAPRRMIEGIEAGRSRSFVVQYEQLVDRPREVVHRLCEFLGLAFEPRMIEYGGSPPPEGRHGDKARTHTYKQPSQENVDNWRRLTETSQELHFARSYLNSLGVAVDALGYSFEELSQALSEARPRDRGPVFPWGLALRPTAGWGRKQRLVARRVLAVQRHGAIRGNWLFLRENAWHMIRALFPG